MARRTITQRYSIKCLSPLYLKAEEEPLLPISYVILDGICYIIDINELLTEKKELLIDFRNELEEQKDQFQLSTFLAKNHLLDTEFLNKICTYKSKADEELDGEVIHPFVKNAFSQPHIPASFIEEAIKIALLSDRIKRYLNSPNKIFLYRKHSYSYRRKRFRKKKRIQIERLLGDIRKGKIDRWKNLAEIFFGQFLFYENKKSKKSPPKGKKDYQDIFRTIFITDTLRAGQALVYPIKLVNKEKEYVDFIEEVSPTYRECLSGGTSVETRLTFDIELWKKFSSSRERLRLPFSNLTELFKKVDSFYRQLWDNEAKYWQNIKKRRKVEEQTLTSFSALQNLVKEDLLPKETNNEDELNIEQIRQFYNKKPDSKGFLFYLGGSEEQKNLVIKTALQLYKDQLPTTREVYAKGQKVISPTGWVLLYRH